ncbi:MULTISPECIES: hypothetical protein [Halorussus]|uniref:hypothetical protein n=1 Tax=Halorussus TaxID=1070314 RepID=UPI0013B3C847|nr:MULTISPECIES: hypothetical protein [Halorussus]NHN58360.1 hypothetical protein [Halorussus sp. JP-T4]
MTDYQHVMYASKSAVKQAYSELYGDVEQIEIERGSRVMGSVRGKLGSFFSFISSTVSGEVTKSEIHSINFDDDMLKAKKLANEILSDEEIPSLSEVSEEGLDLSQLYRFSCEVSTKPFESDVDGETYIEVAGQIGDVKFRGETSTDNWGSRSHVIQSVRAAKYGETYPYQGLLWPIQRTGHSEHAEEYDVQFLLICSPERELRDRWYNQMNP